ncbi:hypothetical protein EON64_19095, partial [archaeon]
MIDSSTRSRIPSSPFAYLDTSTRTRLRSSSLAIALEAMAVKVSYRNVFLVPAKGVVTPQVIYNGFIAEMRASVLSGAFLGSLMASGLDIFANATVSVDGFSVEPLEDSPTPQDVSSSLGIILGASLGGFAFLVMLACAVYLYYIGRLPYVSAYLKYRKSEMQIVPVDSYDLANNMLQDVVLFELEEGHRDSVTGEEFARTPHDLEEGAREMNDAEESVFGASLEETTEGLLEERFELRFVVKKKAKLVGMLNAEDLDCFLVETEEGIKVEGAEMENADRVEKEADEEHKEDLLLRSESATSVPDVLVEAKSNKAYIGIVAEPVVVETDEGQRDAHEASAAVGAQRWRPQTAIEGRAAPDNSPPPTDASAPPSSGPPSLSLTPPRGASASRSTRQSLGLSPSEVVEGDREVGLEDLKDAQGKLVRAVRGAVLSGRHGPSARGPRPAAHA